MLSKNEAALIYETLLTSPGMGEEVKISMRITRKNILLLSKVIEVGLLAKGGADGDGIINIANGNHVDELKTISAEILSKAGLTETYQRLNTLQSKG